jgi:ribosome biogenesis protein ENP2
MVEEMAEEVRTETYDNYKFLTLPELKSLSLDHLIGKTHLLRPYMHGYFVASKLYDQARLIANPYVWEEERMKRIKEKVEKERESRIRGKKKVKVNQRLADKLLERQENREKVDTEAGMLGDDRFASMFTDEAFKVDEASREFRALNPNTAPPTDGPSGSSFKPRSFSAGTRPSAPASGVDMKVSSSGARGPKDTAFGARPQKGGRVSKNRGDVGGERSVTFVPEARRRKPQQSEQQFDAKPRGKKGDRRSASANTMRKL